MRDACIWHATADVIILFLLLLLLLYCVKYNNIWKKFDRTKNKNKSYKTLWTYRIYIKSVGVDEYTYMLYIYYIYEVRVNIYICVIHKLHWIYLILYNIPTVRVGLCVRATCPSCIFHTYFPILFYAHKRKTPMCIIKYIYIYI